jgi:hypothetical protein
VTVHIDEAGGDDLASALDDLTFEIDRDRGYLFYSVVLNEQVTPVGRLPGTVDYQTILQQQSGTGTPFDVRRFIHARYPLSALQIWTKISIHGTNVL